MRTFLLLVALALAGCDALPPTGAGTRTTKTMNDPIPKPQAVKASDAKASDAPSTGSAPPNSPSTLSPPPGGDPRIRVAELSREALGRREEELVDRIDRIRKLLGSVEGKDKGGQSVAEFKQLAAAMRDVVRESSEGMTALQEACDGLARELKHAPAAYRTAAEAYRDRAEDYTDEAMKAQIQGFAEDFEAVANALPDRQQELKAFGKQMVLMRGKLTQARQFLDDMVLFLDSHPGFGAADPRERYAGQLELFARSFSEVNRLLQEFRERLRGKAVSKAIRGQVEKEELARRKEAEAELARKREDEDRQRAAEQARELAARQAEAAERERQADLLGRARTLSDQFARERWTGSGTLGLFSLTEATKQFSFPTVVSLKSGDLVAVLDSAGQVIGAAVATSRTDDGRWVAEVVAGRADAGSQVIAPVRVQSRAIARAPRPKSPPTYRIVYYGPPRFAYDPRCGCGAW